MLKEWHEEVEAVYDQVVAWRRHLHENPELPFQEVQTARMVGDILAGYEIKVQRNIGGHGVVGILKGGKTGELNSVEKLENFKIFRFEKPRDFVWNLKEDEIEELKKEIKEGYDFILKVLEKE